VILLDLAMPERSGVDVLRELKSDTTTEEVPVIIVSAYTAQMGIDDERLADGVIQKPFDLADLLDQVERVRAVRARSISRLHPA
jgi:CheY-like chemotaxis protein